MIPIQAPVKAVVIEEVIDLEMVIAQKDNQEHMRRKANAKLLADTLKEKNKALGGAKNDVQAGASELDSVLGVSSTGGASKEEGLTLEGLSLGISELESSSFISTSSRIPKPNGDADKKVENPNKEQ